MSCHATELFSSFPSCSNMSSIRRTGARCVLRRREFDGMPRLMSRKHFEKISAARVVALSSLLLLAFLAKTATAQVAPGAPNFSAYDPHEVDTVNLMSNNILLDIPIRAKSGSMGIGYHIWIRRSLLCDASIQSGGDAIGDTL